MGDQEQGGAPSGADEPPPAAAAGPENGAPSSHAATGQGGADPGPTQQQLDRDLVKWTRGLADWTKALAICTGILVVAAGLQFWVMWRQLGEMKSARESGNTATAAQLGVMQTQATAIQQQLAEMKTASAQTERAIAATNRLAEQAARSADETHRLAEEAARSADESHRLADTAAAANGLTRQIASAATKANEINRQSLTGVQRAFIVVARPKFELADINNKWPAWTIEVTLANNGNTPSVNLTVRTRCETDKKGVQDPYTLPTPLGGAYAYGVPIKVELAQRQEKEVQRCAATTGIQVYLRDPKSVVDTRFTYAFGSAEYQDVFDPSSVHLTEFCFIVYRTDFFINGEASSYPTFGDLEQWIRPCPTHNCVDDECNADDRQRATNDLIPPAAPKGTRNPPH